MPIKVVMNVKRLNLSPAVITPIAYESNKESAKNIALYNVQNSKKCLKRNIKNIFIKTVGAALIVTTTIILEIIILYSLQSLLVCFFFVINFRLRIFLQAKL